MSYDKLKEARVRLRERILSSMGGKCAICGYDKCPEAIEMHHLDPSQKEFSISQNANRAWLKVSEELQKCIALCANCHRELHYGLINDGTLISSYDFEIGNRISEEIEATKRKDVFCLDCGIKIHKNAKRCVRCQGEHRRLTPRPSKEELKEMIFNEPFLHIAKRYDVSDNTIRKWCIGYGLPHRKRDIEAIKRGDII